MEIDKKALMIGCLAIIVGTLLMLVGIITSEIEITKNESKGIYDKANR